MVDIVQNLKNIIEKIINDIDIVSCYRELTVLFENNNMYQEQAGCLERIAHITEEPYLYEQMGNIFKNKIENNSAAFASYSKYLSLIQPDFYKNYSETFENKFSLNDNSKYNKDFVQLADKYIVIIYILVYLYNIKNYDDILKFENYLDIIDSKIKKTLKNLPKNNKDILEDIEDAKHHLSSLLVNILNNKNLNKLAVKLNPKNEVAYLNVIYNLINDYEIKSALKFFNDKYIKEFNEMNKIISEKKLLWIIASKYIEYKMPFEAVNCEKKVIDMELATYEK